MRVLRPLPDVPSFSARAYRKLLRARDSSVLSYIPDVIRSLHAWKFNSHAPIIVNNDPELAACISTVRPNARVISIFHNELALSRPWLGYVRRSNVTHVAVSRYLARSVAAQLALPLSNVQVVYNGVDYGTFHPEERLKTNHPPVIGFVGRVGREKGLDVLLEACQDLAQSRSDFSVTIIGSNRWGPRTEDDYQRELDSQVAVLRKLGISVSRLGHLGRADLPMEIRKFDVQVIPSRWAEPFGLVALEGMASGVATITSDRGGLPELMSSAGHTFPSQRPERLADELRLLLDNPALRDQLGVVARERALQFSWRNTWTMLENLLLV